MLVIFDIDGTLTRTVDLDTSAFATAFRSTFGAELPSLDWASYRDATESGVAFEAATAVLGRPPAPAELEAMQDEFLLLLRQALAGLRSSEVEMPGATGLIRSLMAGGHEVALATGCWRRSAEAKLEAAGLDVAGLPIATADDAVERTAIMRFAAERAGHDPTARHVYVGDGLWDMRASAALGWDFVGVGLAGSTLAMHGADRLVPDFSDLEGVHELLAACGTGHPSGPAAGANAIVGPEPDGGTLAGGLRTKSALPVLRHVTAADIGRFFEHQLDPAANWMAASTSDDPSDRNAFEAGWKRTLEDPSIIPRTIVSDAEAVGYVATFLRNGTREVAYWIGRAHWGRGIASSAVAQFLGEIESRPMVARTVKDNVASLRVLEKCGFRRIGEDRFFSHARNQEVEEFVLALPSSNP
ncbi:MAG TPA: GNAT family N-acetyltransferase [Vulgatibacter sp.]